jgi:hypothetical protein
MKRVLVVNNGSILEEGITRLLSARKGFNVMNTGFEGMEKLVTCIESTKPAVVVINRSLSIDQDCLNDCLSDASGLKFVLVDEDSNTITLYENKEERKFTVHNFQDIFPLITVQ